MAVDREGEPMDFRRRTSDALDRIGEELHIPTRELMQLQDARDETVGNAIKYSGRMVLMPWPSSA